mmetsp:Transcript_74868/g.173546  ORF Transcript_74868/g.173546 Transcript_74868/m.173546 type:complete len:431 (+) Transcript_74868:125-1417(+)|eukprot:CAMPEP_0171063202 /NCGR_PEP_ID=MMETSP0766_2-20121228/5501_1 /TAXON_ID=439317 /ORGANISM="Gambierdiscus australes, Strain CAWD 149" /LENGTH=430 /DNA_ID=CAMNT_0011519063 /DNA_START=120 /DNA_END=1412 /DNA_ORIENTATION=+
MSAESALPAALRDPDTCILARLLNHSEEGVEVSKTRERRWHWARPQVEGTGPSARGGHSATLVGPTDPQKASARIFLFAGHYDNGAGEGFSFLNDTHILDIDENAWYQPRCRGTAPEPRYGHSAALVGTRIVYFGGKGASAHFRDLHALDASSLTWYQGPSSGGAPSARHGHTATLHGTRLCVFGGACGAKYFGDLHCLDLSSMAWSSPPTTGPKPMARFGHAALLVGDSLLVHGGFCMESAEIATKDSRGDLMKNCYLNDIRVLDVGRMQWSRLRTHGSPPSGRFGHSLVLSDDDVVLFGGWSGAPRESTPGSGTTSLRQRVAGGETPYAGGQHEEETCDYCMTLRTSDMSWVRNRHAGAPASRRYGHTATAIGPHLIIIGGWDGGKPLGDVVVLRDRSAASNERPAAVSQGAAEEEDEDDFVLETSEG